MAHLVACSSHSFNFLQNFQHPAALRDNIFNIRQQKDKFCQKLSLLSQ